MLGIHTPPQPAATPGSPTTTPAQAAATDQTAPPLPSTYQAVSPAALAVGETATPEKGRELRIPGDTPTPAGLPGTAAARGVAPGGAPGVQVGNPVPAGNGSTSNLAPVPMSGAPLPQPSVSNVPASSGAAMTVDQAQRLLKQYGVSWQRSDMFDGQWKFACGIPNPSNPAMNRHFTTTKPFPDEVSAIREVLSQIEKDPMINKQIK